MNQEKRRNPAYNWVKMLLLLPFLGAAIFVQATKFVSDETQTAANTLNATLVIPDNSSDAAMSQVQTQVLEANLQETKKEKQIAPKPEKAKDAKADDPKFAKINQKDTTALKNTTTEIKEIFTVVEEMPVFAGGTDAMMKFISNNIQYPEKAKKDSIQGRVFVNFVVEADGKVTNAKVLRGIGGT